MEHLKTVYYELTDLMDRDSLIRNAPMKQQTSFRAGGNADLLVIPKNSEELTKVMGIIYGRKVDFFIMGNGTNLLVKDGGFRGAIVKIGSGIGNINVEKERIHAGAGALLSEVSAKALEFGLTGFEFASGIPGSIGGAAYMNAGAYGGDMGDVVEQVRVLCKDGNGEYVLSKQEMEYGYRRSALMDTEDIIVSVSLKLSRGNRDDIYGKMQEFACSRKNKQPFNYPSAGSFFKRPKGYFAGKLIEEAGMKGARVGGAGVSTLHAGFIINEKDATAKDIIELMKEIQHRVHEKAGVWLFPEVRIIGEEQV